MHSVKSHTFTLKGRHLMIIYRILEVVLIDEEFHFVDIILLEAVTTISCLIELNHPSIPQAVRG